MIVLTGLFDTGSNVLFLLATAQGDLTIVAVLSSLYPAFTLSLIHISEPTRLLSISYAVFCWKKKTPENKRKNAWGDGPT